MNVSGKKQIIKVLLVCGILSSLLYIATDIIAATMLYPGYSYTSQQVSELSAIGAPTKSLWIAMSSVWSPLVIAFCIGVWLLAGQKHTLRVTGILIALWGILGFMWLFFPMHMRGTETSTTDVMHVVFAAAQVLLMVLFIAFGAAAHGKGFRIYSIGTIVALLVFGALTGMQAPAIATGQPTPWMGIIERVSVYAPMLWMLIFAIVLFCAQSRSYPTSLGVGKMQSSLLQELAAK